MSSLLEKALSLPWEPLFKAQSLERGLSYAREHRIVVQQLMPDLVRTACRGSALQTYVQTLQFKDPDRTRHFVVGVCTCPVRNNCKHCAAALYYLSDPENKPGVLAAVERERPVAEAPATPSSPLPERIEKKIKPQPRLTLASFEFSAYEPRNGKMQRHVQHRAALAFRYRELYASGIPAPGRPSDLLWHLKEETLRLRRHLDLEAQYRKQLQDLGFRIATRQSKALPDSAGEMLELPTDKAWLTFMLDELPKLRASGWQIEMAPDFGFDVTPVEDWYAVVDEQPERDWFDLELGIIVNGERLSLLPILINLLRTHPELMSLEGIAKRRDDEQLLVQLNHFTQRGGGPIQVALPYGRLRPVLATLGDFYWREDGNHSIRVKTADAGRLTHLDDMPLVWQGGDRLRQFAERLVNIKDARVTPPDGLNATLRPYQLEGLSWMQALRELEVGGVLADDMGLGKTLQTLAHLLKEKEAGRLTHPALAVMPTSLIPNWMDEAKHFTAPLKVLALYGANRHLDFNRLNEYDLILTTYALLPRDVEILGKQLFHVLVLDEAQYIKNPGSKAAQAARQLNARQRLCLSGTPLENHLGELWSLFHFLMPGWLGDAKQFGSNYRTPIERLGDEARLQHLNARIRPFLLRRTKEQVATELPPKTEIVHWVELNDAQRDVYETMRLAMDKKVRDEITAKGAARSQIIILEALLKLRQVCCDLRLVKSAPATGRHSSSAKLESLMDMIEELLAENRRILLFSQFTSMLELIEAELAQRGIAYALLTGQTRDRRTPVQEFQSGKRPIFLISLKAGGTGLNLTAADTVIHYDPWWNPAAENQATDRAYRIGQEKPVFVYKMIARGTVEEKIQHLQQEKSALAAGILDGRKAGDWKLQEEDIEALFAPLPAPPKKVKR
ncbi:MULTISPECIES: DEAD/DEAH box helicase [unclassified Pseudomonas]|uniref:DEAD/DEAH box helicase n=1 Tax=unclassified Pseudomonas TaxID=196821 RepID=UPI000D3DB75E|nr:MULTISPECIES: DEAD/DEAH box helicase [unclassified Pseudomonas]RAU45131.1 ATP-dependent helicase [Pseudomonas sp. RIT 409]RAU51419.1 ATP-dependent helicase [Pseudomonas sp. RIT 412]